MIRRLIGCALLCWTALAIAPAAGQQAAPLALKTAGRGSSFMPYGEGVAHFLAAKNIIIEVKDSSGSNENLTAVDASATTLGTAFLGSAYDAVHGLGWAWKTTVTDLYHADEAAHASFNPHPEE